MGICNKRDESQMRMLSKRKKTELSLLHNYIYTAFYTRRDHGAENSDYKGLGVRKGEETDHKEKWEFW